MNILIPNRKQVVTPYDMPLFWKPSGSVRLGAYNSNLTASTTGYFTGIGPNTYEGATYAYTTTANTLVGWSTIVNVTGKGVFIDAESRATDVASVPTIALKITIDGKIYTFSKSSGAFNSQMRLFLGLYIPVGAVYTADADTSVRLGTTSLYGSPGGPTAVSDALLYKPSIATILERMSGKLPTFKTSLKVETISSINGSGATDFYASCRYRLD